MAGDPFEVADSLGVAVRCVPELEPGQVLLLHENTIVFVQDPLESVCRARVWEGLAHLLMRELSRATGCRWTPEFARRLADDIRDAHEGAPLAMSASGRHP